MAYELIKENLDALAKETDTLTGRDLIYSILSEIDKAHSDIKKDYFSALEQALNDNLPLKDAYKDVVDFYKKELKIEKLS
jgi:hypothetical protein